MDCKKDVRFSDSSRMYVYIEDPHYAQSKSYSALDKKQFGQNAIGDALRIMKILHNSKTTSRELSLADRLKVCGISDEEIVGIEHLILEDPRCIYMRRRSHAKAILHEQMKQGTDTLRLGKISAHLAKRPTLHARKRAAMAA